MKVYLRHNEKHNMLNVKVNFQGQNKFNSMQRFPKKLNVKHERGSREWKKKTFLKANLLCYEKLSHIILENHF